MQGLVVVVVVRIEGMKGCAAASLVSSAPHYLLQCTSAGLQAAGWDPPLHRFLSAEQTLAARFWRRVVGCCTPARARRSRLQGRGVGVEWLLGGGGMMCGMSQSAAFVCAP